MTRGNVDTNKTATRINPGQVVARRCKTTIFMSFISCGNNYCFTRRVTCDKVTRRMFIPRSERERRVLRTFIRATFAATSCPEIRPEKWRRTAHKSAVMPYFGILESDIAIHLFPYHDLVLKTSNFIAARVSDDSARRWFRRCGKLTPTCHA